MKIELKTVQINSPGINHNNLPAVAVFRWSEFDKNAVAPHAMTTSYQVNLNSNGVTKDLFPPLVLFNKMSDMPSRLEVSIVATQKLTLIKSLVNVLANAAVGALTENAAMLPLEILKIFTNQIHIGNENIFLLGNCEFKDLIPSEPSRPLKGDLIVPADIPLVTQATIGSYNPPNVFVKGTYNGFVTLNFSPSIIVTAGSTS